MKRTFFRSLLLMIAVSGLALSSCKKTNTSGTTQDASNTNTAENTYNDVHNISDQAASTGTVAYKDAATDQTVASSAVVIIDSITSPGHFTITINFGTTDVVCADGRTRRGKIIVNFDGRYWATGTVITTTFDGYYVNDNQVLGTHVVTNTGNNTGGQPTFTVQVTGSIILANNGGTITWNSTRTRTYLAGYNTPANIFDDKIQVTGSAYGTTASGDAFTATITNPLLRDFTCPLGAGRWHFVQGTIDLTITGKPDVVLDYGTGTCDNQATVTINGHVYTITLG
jgi:hypothetical protein